MLANVTRFSVWIHKRIALHAMIATCERTVVCPWISLHLMLTSSCGFVCKLILLLICFCLKGVFHSAQKKLKKDQKRLLWPAFTMYFRLNSVYIWLSQNVGSVWIAFLHRLNLESCTSLFRQFKQRRNSQRGSTVGAVSPFGANSESINRNMNFVLFEIAVLTCAL